MFRRVLLYCLVAAALSLPAVAVEFAAAAAPEEGSPCIGCHQKVTPGIVRDFKASLHAKTLYCTSCHGSSHRTGEDVAAAKLPTAKTCGGCHRERFQQFSAGKHALAWEAMEAMPSTGLQPHAFIFGLKGCGGCHKIGLRQEVATPGERRYGTPCDSCHTRHRFSRAEALSPMACRTCHMGFDHAQWEMWSSSKHGVIYQLEGPGRAPSCQTCHLQGGNHRNITAWGFLGLRLPEPDKEWLGWRTTILKGIGVLTPDGQPTPRLEAVKKLNVARLTAEAWQQERDKMLDTCAQCHARGYAKASLEAGDAMLREADKLTAGAIDTVAGLYKDKLLTGPGGYPDVLTFYNAKSPIEQTLYVMFLEHRNRTFQGAFHLNPDYATWYGLAELHRDVVEIGNEAERMRGKK